METIIKKRFLPFGKKAAWAHLAHAWAMVDRSQALNLLTKLKKDDIQNIIHNMQMKKPLTEDEWQQASQNLKDIGQLLVKLLLQDGQIALNFPISLIPTVGKFIIKNIDRKPPIESEERAVTTEWNNYFNCAMNLVAQIEPRDINVAHQFMVDIITCLSVTNYFQKWPDRFSSLRETINNWVTHGAMQPEAWEFLTNIYQGPGKDLMVTQWLAMASYDMETATKNLQLLKKQTRDWPTARTWFMVVLTRKGLSDVALSIARKTKETSHMSVTIRRALLLTNPEPDRGAFDSEHFNDDPIACFLLKPDVKSRVEYLKKITNDGNDPLPESMWRKPNLDKIDILHEIIDKMKERGESAFTDEGISDKTIQEIANRQVVEMERSLISAYCTNETSEKQFKQYVRMKGFSYYTADYLDPLLLESLVFWENESPDQVANLLNALWKVIHLDSYKENRKDMALLMDNIARNNHFKRIYTIFSVQPHVLDKLFLTWLKTDLIKNGVSETVGDQIRTLSFNESSTFLYSFLAAVEVGRYSVKTRDDILMTCMQKYSKDATSDLISEAGKLYAGDNPFNALVPSVEVKDDECRQAWQLGVINSSENAIFNALYQAEQEG